MVDVSFSVPCRCDLEPTSKRFVTTALSMNSELISVGYKFSTLYIASNSRFLHDTTCPKVAFGSGIHRMYGCQPHAIVRYFDADARSLVVCGY